MNIITKIYKHFIYNPIISFLFLLSSNINKKRFVSLFNFYSLLKKSNNRIFLKDNFFYNTELDWRFSIQKSGLHYYGSGFKSRKEELLKSYLIKDIEIKDNDIVIDIGANNGDFYLCFNKKIYYYGFEPSPIIFSDLEYNVKNQKLFNFAVSNSDNINQKFYISDSWGDSSILPINNYTNIINVKSITLDSVIDKIQKKIKLVKLEAEGFEPEILQGLKKYLNYVEYITIDCGFERGVKQESTLVECCNYLMNNNFKIIDFGAPRIVTLFKNLNI
tara:strand:- start:46 stop:870 length:825 start_codon:yes stop_codon:yes gene_type:complete